MHRAPAVLPNGVDVDAGLDQQFCSLERLVALLRNTRPLNIGTAAGRHHQRGRALLRRDPRVRACRQQCLDRFRVVDFRSEKDRGRALQAKFRWWSAPAAVA